MISKMKKRLRATASVAAATAAMLGAASAQQVYSFGDSLSDIGNVNDFSLGLVAGGDYFDGRFSNGYLWVDYISWAQTGEIQRKNPGLVGPYFTRTTRPYNFAHGGAVSGELSPDVDTGLLSGLGFLSNIGAFRVTQQAKHFRDTSFFGATFRASSSDFATISAGGNDYFAGETNVSRVVGNTITAMNYIRGRGIRNFIVLDVPNVGDTPANYGTSGQAFLNSLSASHNIQIRNAAASYEATNSGSIVAIVPAARLFELVVDDAINNGGGVYGFTNVRPGAGTSGYCLGDGLRLSACPDTYLFYDDIHPTAKAHYMIADLAIASFNNKVLGLSEPLSQSASAKTSAAQSSRVVTSRVAALRLGMTGSGQLSDPMTSLGFDGFGAGSLSFNQTGQLAPGQSKLSVWGFSEGLHSELVESGQHREAAEQLKRQSLALQPGEAISTMGADVLLENGMAIGAAFTQGAYNRERLTTHSFDETRTFTVFGAMFRGPMTYSLTATSTDTEQERIRSTGFRWQPFVASASQSVMREVVGEAQWNGEAGAWSLTGTARIAHAHLDLDALEETGSDGLLDRNIGAQSLSGQSAYLGMKAERALPGNALRGLMSFEAGPVAGTSDMLGYAAVMGDAFLFGSMPEAVNVANPLGATARSGMYTSARIEMLATDNLAIAARAGAVTGAAHSDSVVELNAVWRF